MSRVLTVGTFDLFHSGHINLLANCAKIAGAWDRGSSEKDHVIVGLNSDEFVEAYKGKKPIYSYNERLKLLANSRYVYSVSKNSSSIIEPLLIHKGRNARLCDILVVGSDWAKKDYYAQIGISQEQLDKWGILLCYIPYTEGISTTQLKERIIGS